jgi:hypothetical protein
MFAHVIEPATRCAPALADATASSCMIFFAVVLSAAHCQ